MNQPTTQEILALIASKTQETTQALIGSESFSKQLARNIAQELYIPPLPKVPLFSVRASDFQVEPLPLVENTMLVLTKRPIDVTQSFVVMVLMLPMKVPAPQSKLILPTVEGKAAPKEETIMVPYSVVYQDVPGDVTRNAVVSLRSEYSEELHRQINLLDVTTPIFYYLSIIGQPAQPSVEGQ
jgi:hypothetical protein